MEHKKANRQVLMICLIITAAFAVSLILFLSASSGVIHGYTESLTAVCASDVEENIKADADRLRALLDLTAEDGRLKAAAADTEKDNGNLKGINDILAEYRSRNSSMTFSYIPAGALDGEGNAGVDDFLSDYVSAGGNQMRFYFVLRTKKDEPGGAGTGERQTVLTAVRGITDGTEKRTGILYVSAPAKDLTDLMDLYHTKYGTKAFYMKENGDIVLAGAKEGYLGKNAFTESSLLAGRQADFDGNLSETAKLWLSRGTLFGKNQSYCEVHYSGLFHACLVIVNDNTDLYTEQRQQMATLVVLILVVLVLIILMITAVIRQYRARIIAIAATDELTGLPNRKSFMREYEKLESSGMLQDAVIFLLDIDFFKKINDSFGHLMGDQALSYVADRVKQLVSGRGIAGRWGGDEFIGVLTAEEKNPQACIEEMIREIAGTVLPSGVRISVSIGAAAVLSGQELNKNVEYADEALYQSKKNGRGLLTVYVEGKTPKISYTEVSPQPETEIRPEAEMMSGAETMPGKAVRPAAAMPETQAAPQAETRQTWYAKPLNALIYAVSGMIPFVAGGGILIAIAFLIDGASVNVVTLDPELRSSFGSITPLAKALFSIGSTTFNFMLPVFAAYLSYWISGKEGIAAGFIGGYISAQGSAGFAGAILAGFFTGYIVLLMKNFLKEMPEGISGAAQILVYPVLSLLIMNVLMIYIISPFASAFNNQLSMLLSHMTGSRTLLGAVSSAMMASDMGGPINKAAYHFGTAGITAGKTDIMAAVMVGGMVPPCGIAVSAFLFPRKFTKSEICRAPVTLIMGLAFITEGALPYLITDIGHVLPCCMLGAGLAGALSIASGCTLPAPHGGIFVLPVVGEPVLYFAALAAGTMLTAILLGITRPAAEPQTQKFK